MMASWLAIFLSLLLGFCLPRTSPKCGEEFLFVVFIKLNFNFFSRSAIGVSRGIIIIILLCSYLLYIYIYMYIQI